MQLTSQQTLPVGQLKAWEALNDIAMLQAAIPGCESITPTGPHHFEVVVTAAVGPVKAKFKGKLRLDDIHPPESYSLHFEGQGGAAGHGKGQAAVRLQAMGLNETVLHYTAHASVGGKIAQIGSRLVDMAAQKMATEFFERFTASLVDKYGVAAAQEQAAQMPPGLLTRIALWFKRLFGG